ncbi:redoxin domain-containing protein [candidate division KSB1 bacterium]|nr:redoxin domain-containing protein [candidate division KSB1 bacterium]
MRKVLGFSLLLSLFLILGCGEQFPEKFSYLPEKPQANQKITLKYNPAGTNLEGAKEIEALAYQFHGAEMPVVKEVALKKKGKGWIGTVTPDDSALLLIVNFKSEEGLDNNEEAGYKIILSDAEKNNLPGALGTVAYAVYYGTYPTKLKRDVNLAFEMLKKEFAAFPESKSKFNFLYWSLLPRMDKENGKSLVKADLDSIASQKEISLDDKKLLANWYARVDEPKKAEKYKIEVIEADPDGDLAQYDRYRNFRSLTNLKEKIKFYREFKNDFPESRSLNSMTLSILDDFAEAKRYDEAEEFLNKNVSNPSSNLLNTVAWEMVEKEINLKTAAELAKNGVELARKEIENPTSKKPSYITEKQWRKNLKMPLGNILDTYGFALYKLGQAEESLPHFAEAVEIFNKGNKDVNERYAEALFETGKTEKAYAFAEECLKEGKKTPKIEEVFKKSWLAVKGSDEGLEDFFTKLNAEGIQKLKDELAKKLLDKPAPDFTLEDLEGNTVSLSDLKGKTIILDFWATWCGPCIRSFPGMQKAVDKFKDDDSVKFLFINTWERGEGVKEKVAKFIKEKEVTFQVLMDSENKVVEAYGVEGIPTKFVVDKEGKIRFKSVGFGGDDDKLVDELSLMIEMVK